MYRISVNLENFRFWDQICPKNMNDKNLEKNKHYIRNKHIAMCPCTKFHSIWRTLVFRTKFAKKNSFGQNIRQAQPENNFRKKCYNMASFR